MVKLEELLTGLDDFRIVGSADCTISSLVHDSREVADGSLFCAVRGFNVDGNRFVPNAVKAGAAAVLTDETALTCPVPVIQVSDARKAMALLADAFYGNPQEKLIMTGVTGTNGKTTTTYMQQSIFSACGLGCGVIGTIGHIVGENYIESKNTTPEAPDIHRYLAEMCEAGQGACAMEVSSHALSLSRVYGINYRAAAFLNLTHDHLDFYGDLDKYLEAKGILFSELPSDSTAVINVDDPHADYILDLSRRANVIRFGESKDSDIRPTAIELNANGSKASFTSPAGNFDLELPIPGKYNLWNAMAAAGLALACSVPLDMIVKGLSSMPQVRGRYEIVDEGQPFAVIVDYAHTPDSLDRVLASARELTKGRLISVFGCGGDRDRKKRPVMGAISTGRADFSFVTSDNPRTENPEQIISDIVEGLPSDAAYKTVTDREEAIAEAIRYAKEDDTVVISGKGHETYIILGTKKHFFDDAETAGKYLRELS